MARRKKTGILSVKRPKIACEVCGESNKSVLHSHHIVERGEINSNNNDYNIGIVCSNCHNKIHAGELRIIGVFPGTKPPTGRILIYELNGKKNIDIDDPYYTPTPPSMRLSYE